MKKLKGGFIQSPFWEEEVFVRGEPRKDRICNMLIWGPLTREVTETVKNGNCKAEFGVDIGRTAPGKEQFINCVAKQQNYAYAHDLKQGDWIIACGTWRSHPYYKAKTDEWKEKVYFTVEAFLQNAALLPMSSLRPMADGDEDIFEGNSFAEFDL